MRLEVQCLEDPPGTLVHVVASWNASQPPLQRSIAPSAVDLGDVTYGTPGTPTPVTSTNTGTQPLPIGGSIASFAEVPTDVLIDVAGYFGGPTASPGGSSVRSTRSVGSAPAAAHAPAA